RDLSHAWSVFGHSWRTSYARVASSGRRCARRVRDHDRMLVLLVTVIVRAQKRIGEVAQPKARLDGLAKLRLIDVLVKRNAQGGLDVQTAGDAQTHAGRKVEDITPRVRDITARNGGLGRMRQGEIKRRSQAPISKTIFAAQSADVNAGRLVT